MNGRIDELDRTVSGNIDAIEPLVQSDFRMDKFEEKLDVYTLELSKFEENMQTLTNIVNELKSKPKPSPTAYPSETCFILGGSQHPSNASDDRSRNIIIFNLPESNSNLKDEVASHDKKLITELDRFLLGEDLKFTTRRLGSRVKHPEPTDSETICDESDSTGKGPRKRDTSGELYKPRPLRVQFDELDSKIKVMKNIFKLGNSDIPGDLVEISVKHDITPDQRITEKNIKEQAKSLNAAEK